MFSFADFGNDLYTGKRSYDFVGRRRTFYTISAVIVVLCFAALGIRGLNAGIEFRGGTEFRVSDVADVSEQKALDALSGIVAATDVPRVSVVGGDTMRVQTEALSTAEAADARDALAQAYAVPSDDVTVNSVGPSWGSDVSRKALTGLVVFLVLVAVVIALYFRTWKMAVSALVALAHDLVITVGVYAAVGFEVTPASVIGFLTILGYSLYDTVVVFDKVRENTEHVTASTRRTFAEAANLAVNQTLVRSINTSVVALLPVAAILFIGAFILGAGTLQDLALALFVGMAVGTFSSIFIATPLLVHLREDEPELKAQAERVAKRRAQEAAAAERAEAGEPGEPVTAGAPAHSGATAVTTTGQRQQPRKRSAKGRPQGRSR